MHNNERFWKRKNRVKVIWTLLLLISAIITIVLFKGVLSATNNELFDEYGYILIWLLCVWDFFCLVFWFCSLVGVKFKTYTYNGHTISLYLGWSCAYLILDDDIVDKHKGSFVGAQPLECFLDGERVCLKVGAFTLNRYTLRVGNKILHWFDTDYCSIYVTTVPPYYGDGLLVATEKEAYSLPFFIDWACL